MIEFIDPQKSKEIFNRCRIEVLNENCTIRKMEVRHAQDPDSAVRQKHISRLSKIVNSKPHLSQCIEDIKKNSPNLLPEHSTALDLNDEIYYSVLDFLSITKGYFGFKDLQAGILIKNYFPNWYNSFGYLYIRFQS